MNDTTRRVCGYGTGAAIVAALGYLGFVYEADPDPWTLISGAKLNIELALGVPAAALGADGRPVRESLLGEAGRQLDGAAVIEPGMTAIHELRAWIAYARTDYRAAAECYAEAARQPDCTPEMARTHFLNRGRMLLMAGDPAAARAVLETRRLDGDEERSRQTLLARALWQAERRTEALAVVAELAARWERDTADGIAAGTLYAEFGMPAEAEAAYRRVARFEPAGDYYLARLKLESGEIDTSLELLKRAVATDRTTIERLAERDREIWRPVGEDERFRSLLAPTGQAVPPVGR